MKHFLTAILMVIAVAAQANTDSYKDMETLKLTVPEMKAELGTATTENTKGSGSQNGLRFLQVTHQS